MRTYFTRRHMRTYFLFLDENKAEFSANANGNYKEGISMSAKSFAELPHCRKNIYKNQFEEIRQQYEKDRKAFYDATASKAKDEDEGEKTRTKLHCKRLELDAKHCLFQ